MVWLGFKGRFGFRAQVLGDLGSFFRRGSVGFLRLRTPYGVITVHIT